MEKSRGIKELLQLVLDNVEHIGVHINVLYSCSGMCTLIHRMEYHPIRSGLPPITSGEAHVILKYMHDNEPTSHWDSQGLWWWAPFDHKPRKKWLKEQIKKL